LILLSRQEAPYHGLQPDHQIDCVFHALLQKVEVFVFFCYQLLKVVEQTFLEHNSAKEEAHRKVEFGEWLLLLLLVPFTVFRFVFVFFRSHCFIQKS
jgi:hypothetical protein